MPYTDNVNATTSLGDTSTHLAISFGRCKALEMLLEHGASVTNSNSVGCLPMHLAAVSRNEREEADRVAALRCLLKTHPQLVNATTESPNEDRRTTLHIAVENGQLLVVKCLLECGADNEAPNASGRTDLCYAADFNQNQALTMLLDRDANAMTADCNQCLPIHVACQKGSAALVEILSIRCPECVDSPTKQSDRSRTPLHLAAENGSVECIKTLIACKAEVNTQTTDKRTSFHFAAAQGNTRATEALLRSIKLEMKLS